MQSPESPSLSSPTASELISQLQTSFFPHEFESAAKTLTDREQRLKQKYLNLKAKAKEEKDQLSDELKKKQNEIDAVRLELKMVKEARVCESQELKNKQVEIDGMMKRIADYEMKVRVLSAEKAGKESMGSSVHLEQKDCAAESDRKPLLASVEKGSNRKTDVKMPEIIDIDDDDDVDDDQGKRASNKTKRDYNNEDDDDGELVFKRSWVSKKMKTDHLDKSAKKSPLFEKDELDGSEPDSGSDIEQVQKLYTSSVANLRKQKEGWKSESDMVKDFEKDDELCLNGVCALHRQNIDVNRSDTLRLNSLARKLIDGDSQKKLKKKASELSRLDLDHCRTFAKRYSSRLFKIYLNKSDPFFPASRSQG